MKYTFTRWVEGSEWYEVEAESEEEAMEKIENGDHDDFDFNIKNNDPLELQGVE